MTSSVELDAKDAESFWIQWGKAMVHGWMTIALSVLGAAMIALIYVQVAAPQYQATMTITPVTDSATSNSQLSNVLGLAASFGIGFGLSGQTDFDKFVSLLQSREVSDRLAKNQYLMRKVFPQYWNASSKRFVGPSGVLGILDWIYRLVFSQPAWTPPTGEDLEYYISKNLTVDTNTSDTMVSISFSHSDPKFSSDFPRMVHDQADSIMRENARITSEQRIAYLNKQLLKITQEDQRQALISLLTVEEQKAMLVAADKFYAAAVLDAPALTRWPSWPPAILLVAIATFVGFVLGSTAAILGIDRSIVKFARRIRSRQSNMVSRSDVHSNAAL